MTEEEIHAHNKEVRGQIEAINEQIDFLAKKEHP